MASKRQGAYLIAKGQEERSNSATSAGDSSNQRSEGKGELADYLQNEDLLEILTPDEIEEFKGLFDMFDADSGGTISV